MKRFIEDEDRSQFTLLPECLDDYIGEDNPVRIVDVFVDEIDLQPLGFRGADPAMTGRPAYHPAILLKLFSQAIVAIDSSKFKAVISRDRNVTPNKIDRRQKQIEQSIQRYLDALQTADRTQPLEAEAKTDRLQEKIGKLREQMRQLDEMKEQLKNVPDGKISLTDPDARSMISQA